MQIKLIFTRKARFESEGFWNSEVTYFFCFVFSFKLCITIKWVFENIIKLLLNNLFSVSVDTGSGLKLRKN